MRKSLLLAALALTAVIMAMIPSPARADAPPPVTIPILGMTLELPDGWMDLGDGIPEDKQAEVRQWLMDEGLFDTIAGNIVLENVYWAAINRSGQVAYMNLYDIELFEGCRSVSEFNGESRKIAANWAASDYGLASADSVETVWLPNADFLLARYGDPVLDGFCAVNYLFVWEGRLAGLEFVSGRLYTQDELSAFEQVAASLRSDRLPAPILNEAKAEDPLPVGSEFSWTRYALPMGIGLSLPDWMVPVDSDNPSAGLNGLRDLGVPQERLDQYRDFFDQDPELLTLLANASDYHGYLIYGESGLSEASRMDMLDEQARSQLIERATANDYAEEIIQSVDSACYGGIPMLRIWSREDAEDSMDYVSYLFLSGDTLYTLVFLETWEILPREMEFFDTVAASLSVSESAPVLAEADPSGESPVTIAAVVAVVGLIVAVIIAAVVVLILVLARRNEQSAAAPAAQLPSGEDAASPPRPGASKFCIHCGAPAGPTDRFCSRCGARVR